MFREGNPVLVGAESGNKIPGIFRGEQDGQYIVEIHSGIDGIKEFSKENVFRYEPVSDEALWEWSNKEAPKVAEILQRAFAALHPNVAYQLKMNTPTSLEDWTSIHLDGVSLLPVQVQVTCIGCIREFPAFQLTDWKHHYATRWEPEDVEDIPISTHRNSGDAASALMQYVLALKVRHWFQADGEAQAFAEMDRSPDSEDIPLP